MNKYKTIRQIEKELNKSFLELYNEEIAKGLSLTDIAIKHHIKYPASISTYLYTEKIKSIKPLFDIPVFVGISMQETEKRFEELYNLKLKEFLVKKYIDEKHSMSVIARFLDCSEKTVKNTLQYYGIDIKSHSRARFDAVDTGNINVENILGKVRKTKRKTFISGSFSEQRVRILIQSYLFELFDRNYEIIVGFNEYSVLRKYEVDIPIIIVDIRNNSFFKFAIEINGIHHTKDQQSKRDKLKAELLNKRNWIYKSIVLSNNIEPRLLEEMAKKLSEEIFGFITKPKEDY